MLTNSINYKKEINFSGFLAKWWIDQKFIARNLAQAMGRIYQNFGSIGPPILKELPGVHFILEQSNPPLTQPFFKISSKFQNTLMNVLYYSNCFHLSAYDLLGC